MVATRFFAIKFKDEYSGDDEKSKRIREELFQKHVELYRSRPYVTKLHTMFGGQHPLGQGYHYGMITEFESEDKVAYFDDVDPAHLEFRDPALALIQTLFVWPFPAHD